MKVGNKIRKIRELRNLTQEYIAYQLDISQAAYHKIESDKTNITLNRLEEIAVILEVSVIEIITFEEYEILNNRLHKLRSILDSHNPADKENLLSVLEHLQYQRVLLLKKLDI